jgi:hypothetical protein
MKRESLDVIKRVDEMLRGRSNAIQYQGTGNLSEEIRWWGGIEVKWMGCEQNKSPTSFRVANFAHWISSYLEPEAGKKNTEH